MKIILLQEQVKSLVATIKSEIKSGKIDADQRNLLQEVWKAQKSKTTV